MKDDAIIKVCAPAQQTRVGDLALSLMEGLAVRISRIAWHSR